MDQKSHFVYPILVRTSITTTAATVAASGAAAAVIIPTVSLVAAPSCIQTSLLLFFALEVLGDGETDSYYWYPNCACTYIAM